MSLLIFAIVVLIVAGLLVWAVGLLPFAYPANTIAQAVIIVLAALIICNHAGLLA